MKKAVLLLSVLALAGCDEEDVVNTLNGKAQVFAVTSVKVDDSFINIESLNEDDVDVGFPGGSRTMAENKLGSMGIDIHSVSCGTIDTNSADVCFGENGANPCISAIDASVSKLGLTLFTIDASDVKRVANDGYYPKLAVEFLGGTYSDFTIKDATCSSIEP